MKPLTKYGLLLAFGVLASLTYGNPNRAPDRCHGARAAQITATIFGHFDLAAEGGPGWVGHAIVKMGDGETQIATFTDRSGGPPVMRDDGTILGSETITVTLDNGSGKFEIQCVWEATPETAPALYMLHEYGTIGQGTGQFERASGCVVIKGPFLLPDPTVNPAVLNEDSPPLWIAQLRGKIKGVARP